VEERVRDKSAKYKQKIHVVFQVDEVGGCGDVVLYLQTLGQDPKRQIKEAIATFFGPLAVPEDKCRSFTNRITALRSIYLLLAQIRIIQERFGLQLTDLTAVGGMPVVTHSLPSSASEASPKGEETDEEWMEEQMQGF